MTTIFDSFEKAKATAALSVGLDPAKTDFIEDPELKVINVLDVWGLESSETSAQDKSKIRREIALQRGFRIRNPGYEEITVVIAPLDACYCVWITSGQQTALRI